MDPIRPMDVDLLARLQAGEQDAWRDVYRSHQGRIYRFSMQMCRSSVISEEVTQDTFVTFLQQIERYDPSRASLELWLLGIARRKVLKCLERLRRDAELIDFPSAENVHLDAERRQQQDSIRAAVVSLPMAYREAVVLCDLQQMTYEEAAEVLACPVGTVRSRLHRGRQMLAEKLSAVGAAL